MPPPSPPLLLTERSHGLFGFLLRYLGSRPNSTISPNFSPVVWRRRCAQTDSYSHINCRLPNLSLGSETAAGGGQEVFSMLSRLQTLLPPDHLDHDSNFLLTVSASSLLHAINLGSS